ncbi:MAG: radical SAM protein [Metallosphaera sp.]|uniref:radical SAM protein n=1 Tax=Metallosphaera sp. TaxID=2020860 RepID=UPI003165B303
MISVSRLITNRPEEADRIRYSGQKDRYPSVLVFNVTRNCNLRCLHCYSSSGTQQFYDLPLSVWIEAVKQASDMGVKHILLSGGEPLARRDLSLIAREAWERGIRVELSTNGTMLTRERLEELRKYVDYIGVSLDGPEKVHDAFRGVYGAFSKSIKGLRISKEMGVKTGLRFTITKENYNYVDFLFDLMKKEGIDRVCFYHLAYAGRADRKLDVDNKTRLEVIKKIIHYSKDGEWEVLTADNPVDGILIYSLTRSVRVLDLLRRNGGNKSGERIADVSPEGVVFPDQFTPIPLGEIKNLKRIWDEPGPMLKKLKERRSFVKCSSCRFFEVCNGGLRGRALAATGDLWERDPSCYLDLIDSINLTDSDLKS